MQYLLNFGNFLTTHKYAILLSSSALCLALIQMKNKRYDKYNRLYPPKRGEYDVPGLTTDAVVYRKTNDSKHEILLVTRKHEPCKGMLALPGGYVEYNEEPSKGCLRELKEETNLDGISCKLLCVNGHPLRNLQEHTVTIGYLIEVDQKQNPVAGDDAAEAKFYPLQEVLNEKEKIGFDHYDIIVQSLPFLSENYSYIKE